MRVADLSLDELQGQLHRGQLSLGIQPFAIKVRSRIPQVGENIHRLYADYPLLPADRATDFQVELTHSKLVRRLVRPQTNFSFDGHFPFKPLPREQASALFEWGVNWCVATNAHHYLIIHAAVVAQDDRAVVLPGDPGAGKSTLCAALVSRGWRLLSDEMTLLDPATLQAIPIPRPISLKNASIELIRAFAPEGVFGDTAHDTAKGTVAHLRPPRSSVEQAQKPAQVAAVVFPNYRPGAELRCHAEEKSRTLMGLAQNAFNYHIYGREGFDVLRHIVDGARCSTLSYSRLDDAIECFGALLD